MLTEFFKIIILSGFFDPVLNMMTQFLKINRMSWFLSYFEYVDPIPLN